MTRQWVGATLAESKSVMRGWTSLSDGSGEARLQEKKRRVLADSLVWLSLHQVYSHAACVVSLRCLSSLAESIQNSHAIDPTHIDEVVFARLLQAVGNTCVYKVTTDSHLLGLYLSRFVISKH